MNHEHQERQGRQEFAGLPLIVFYDETCGVCGKIARLLARMPSRYTVWYKRAMEMGAYTPDPDALANRYADIHSLVGPRVLKGYDTYVEIARRTWPLIWLYPILLLPPVRMLGERIYRRIADGRECAVPAPDAMNDAMNDSMNKAMNKATPKSAPHSKDGE